jgi:hypothetical protein
MELHYFSPCMELVMCIPVIVTLIVSLLLNKVFKVIVPYLIVPYSTVKDHFILIFISAIDGSGTESLMTGMNR